MIDYKILSEQVLTEVRTCLSNIEPNTINQYIKYLCKAEKVFFIGIGRVKLSLEAAIKRLSHLGIDCIMVGDLTEPPITDKDLLVVASGSGESIIPYQISKKAIQYGAEIFHITSNVNSSIGNLTKNHLVIDAPNKNSSNKASVQPMSTLFEQSLYIFHDIVAIMIMNKKQINVSELYNSHANLE